MHLKHDLYELRKSLLLWLQEFLRVLNTIELNQVLGKECLFWNNWMLLFFYIDDIVILFWAYDQSKFYNFHSEYISSDPLLCLVTQAGLDSVVWYRLISPRPNTILFKTERKKRYSYVKIHTLRKLQILPIFIKRCHYQLLQCSLKTCRHTKTL